MGIWYAAVEDDPLTSGPGGRVYAKEKVGTIQGDDGRNRRMAFIGDEAWCAACRSIGIISYGTTGLREARRMLDLVNGGRRQAVGDDIVLCKCPVPPRIIAQYGRRWRISDDGSDVSRNAVSTPAPRTHDEQFVLTDAAGNRLPDTCYTVVLPSGELIHGITDSMGRTARYATDGAKQIRLYLGHRDA